jgi:hypothetical protein
MRPKPVRNLGNRHSLLSLINIPHHAHFFALPAAQKIGQHHRHFSGLSELP